MTKLDFISLKFGFNHSLDKSFSLAIEIDKNDFTIRFHFSFMPDVLCRVTMLKYSKKINSEDGQVYSVCILQFSCFTKYNRMQSKHKQTKCEHSRRNSYRFLSRYHYTKSKNYLKRRYRIRH